MNSISIQVPSSGQRLSLQLGARGVYEGTFASLRPGDRYFFCLNDGVLRPDPASRLQPLGVHGPSEVFDQSYHWTDDDWGGVSKEELIIYELHVGTFTSAGTFGAIIPHLPRLRDLGVTALELMPIAQFPGERNWGYDGVFPFAVQVSYGGPRELKRLVDAAHGEGLGIILDVVYNHLGPEGNYLAEYGPYFTDRYRTAWGSALNFDSRDCGAVREYFFQNALYWKNTFHVDGLRLDAVHNIFDQSAVHFLEELRTRVESEPAGPEHGPFHLVAESDLNAPRIIQPTNLGGYGLTTQWCDDFHHALHAPTNR